MQIGNKIHCHCHCHCHCNLNQPMYRNKCWHCKHSDTILYHKVHKEYLF